MEEFKCTNKKCKCTISFAMLAKFDISPEPINAVYCAGCGTFIGVKDKSIYDLLPPRNCKLTSKEKLP